MAEMYYISLSFEYALVWLLLIINSISIPQLTYCIFFTSRIADASVAGFDVFSHMVSLV